MAEMELAATVLRGILHALDQIDKDLNDMIEELRLSETYMSAEADTLADVRGAVRMSFRELAGQREQFVRLAQARAAVEAGDVLTTPTVIDQPVSPAPLED
jgi:hypothetical protein